MATITQIDNEKYGVDVLARSDTRPTVRSLLEAYAGALELARRPPASIALSPRLQRLHRRIRPTFGSHHVATRHVRRRTEALERMLERRRLAAQTDVAGQAELDAVRAFKASLTPPPPRVWTVVSLIAAIVLSQLLISPSLAVVQIPGGAAKRIDSAFRGVSLSPDVKSVGDLSRSLMAASMIELGAVVLTVVVVIYLLGRPLACGYRLAHLCLDPPARLSPRRRRSPLVRRARQLNIAAREAAFAPAASAGFGRWFALDAIVKALPLMAIGFWLVAYARLGAVHGIAATRVLAWLAASAAVIGLLAWSPRRLKWLQAKTWRKLSDLLILAGLAAVAVVAFSGRLPTGDLAGLAVTWLGVLGLSLARLAWLAWHAPRRTRTTLWIGIPLVAIVALGVIARAHPAHLYRAIALDDFGASELPHLHRYDLQAMLTSHRSLTSSDLRGQDLHGMSLRDKRLLHARLAVADLRHADLSDADLRHADLHGALALGAQLRRADLRGADLRCTDLEGADLRSARLDGANLTRAFTDRKTRLPRHSSGALTAAETARHRARLARETGQPKNSTDAFYAALTDGCLSG
jgi:hypothetical protein